jgi:dephospho-CoA kinase
MKKVGITGGIGSGKSVVCNLFKILGIPVYNADDAAKRLMHTDKDVKDLLIITFGDHVYKNDGTLNRNFLADIVFKNEQSLSLLNSLVHPAVTADFKKWESSQKNVPYTVHEAAILFESGTDKGMDYTILVDAPEELRINRIISRDNRSVDSIKSIISRQWLSEKKRKLVNAVIENDEKQLVIPQVLAIHQKLLADG